MENKAYNRRLTRRDFLGIFGVTFSAALAAPFIRDHTPFKKNSEGISTVRRGVTIIGENIHLLSGNVSY